MLFSFEWSGACPVRAHRRMPWKSSRRVATTLLCACARLQLQGNDELTNETMKSSLRKSTLASWFLHLHPCLGYAVTSDGLPRLVSARMPEAERLQLAAGMLSGRLVFRTLLSSFCPSVLPSLHPSLPSFLRSRSRSLALALALALALSLSLSRSLRSLFLLMPCCFAGFPSLPPPLWHFQMFMMRPVF